MSSNRAGIEESNLFKDKMTSSAKSEILLWYVHSDCYCKGFYFQDKEK